MLKKFLSFIMQTSYTLKINCNGEIKKELQENLNLYHLTGVVYDRSTVIIAAEKI